MVDSDGVVIGPSVGMCVELNECQGPRDGGMGAQDGQRNGMVTAERQ